MHVHWDSLTADIITGCNWMTPQRLAKAFMKEVAFSQQAFIIEATL